MPEIEFALVPEDGHHHTENASVTLSSSVWLRVFPTEAFSQRRWVRLRYSVGFFDDVVRPMIRFLTRDGRTIIYPMNGAMLGSAEWLGRIPDHTEAVWISPTSRPDPIAFRIDKVESVPLWRIATRAWLSKPFVFANAVGARIINAQSEYHQLMQYAGIAPTPFAQYDKWHRRLKRPIDIAGFDRPRTSWDSGPRVRLLISPDGGTAGAVMTTLAALQAQAHPHWTLHPLIERPGDDDASAALLQASRDDPRVQPINRRAGGTVPDFADHDIVAAIAAGDVLPNYALACIVERFAVEKQISAIYGDEDSIAKDGTLHSPILRADWSPTRERSRPYVGRPIYVRYAALARDGIAPTDWDLFLDPSRMNDFLLRLEPGSVSHLRRVLYHQSRELTGAEKLGHPIRTASTRDISEPPDGWPRVAVIIPTRDRFDLLSECVRGLKELTDYPAYEVVIVDNDTTDAKARQLLKGLKSRTGFQVLEQPGAFNYSSLCNAGARASTAPVLVFLNNDIAMMGKDWLKPLVAWAVKPHVGVVGTKLLFPDKKIQHAGVAMGLGGICGHIYKGLPGDEPGYLGELEGPHEISAVTGACIAIERRKFELVGGFDAENLPVDLNDIDLCMRTFEHGWINMWTPQSVLFHMESASRGFEFKPFNIYRKEREYFIRRWSHRISEDPFFHPALALYSHQPALA